MRVKTATLGFYCVKIPYWTEGCPLTLEGFRAVSDRDALHQAVQWVNRYAGFVYCIELPQGTKVWKEREPDLSGVGKGGGA